MKPLATALRVGSISRESDPGNAVPGLRERGGSPRQLQTGTASSSDSRRCNQLALQSLSRRTPWEGQDKPSPCTEAQ